MPGVDALSTSALVPVALAVEQLVGPLQWSNNPSLRAWARDCLMHSNPPPFRSVERNQLEAALSAKLPSLRPISRNTSNATPSITLRKGTPSAAAPIEEMKLLASLAPIRLLPVEIMALIFEFYFFAHHYPESKDSPREPPLMSVCRSWRSIALETPQLWSFIHIRIGVSNPLSSDRRDQVVWDRSMARFEKHLTLSKSTPFHLSCVRVGTSGSRSVTPNGTPVHRPRHHAMDMAKRLSPHLYRCRTYGTDCDPFFQSLTMANNGINAIAIQGLPSLRHLTLVFSTISSTFTSTIYDPDSDPPPLITLPNLITLHLSNFPNESIPRFFCPRAIKLTFSTHWSSALCPKTMSMLSDLMPNVRELELVNEYLMQEWTLSLKHTPLTLFTPSLKRLYVPEFMKYWPDLVDAFPSVSSLVFYGFYSLIHSVLNANGAGARYPQPFRNITTLIIKTTQTLGRTTDIGASFSQFWIESLQSGLNLMPFLRTLEVIPCGEGAIKSVGALLVVLSSTTGGGKEDKGRAKMTYCPGLSHLHLTGLHIEIPALMRCLQIRGDCTLSSSSAFSSTQLSLSLTNCFTNKFQMTLPTVFTMPPYPVSMPQMNHVVWFEAIEMLKTFITEKGIIGGRTNGYRRI